jgi:hypothetical protein
VPGRRQRGTVTGTVLQQAALHVGPLSMSPAAAGHHRPVRQHHLEHLAVRQALTASPAKFTVAVLAFAVMAAGVTVLTRAAPQDFTPSKAASP